MPLQRRKHRQRHEDEGRGFEKIADKHPSRSHTWRKRYTDEHKPARALDLPHTAGKSTASEGLTPYSRERRSTSTLNKDEESARRHKESAFDQSKLPIRFLYALPHMLLEDGKYDQALADCEDCIKAGGEHG